MGKATSKWRTVQQSLKHLRSIHRRLPMIERLVETVARHKAEIFPRKHFGDLVEVAEDMMVQGRLVSLSTAQKDFLSKLQLGAHGKMRVKRIKSVSKVSPQLGMKQDSSS